MGMIYEPRGRAREYSPLALNVYNKCDHFCRYCLDGNAFDLPPLIDFLRYASPFPQTKHQAYRI